VPHSRANPSALQTHIRATGRTIKSVAEELGISYAHLINVCYGKSTPCPTCREKLPEILGVPLKELFPAEMLAREYMPIKATRSLRFFDAARDEARKTRAEQGLPFTVEDDALVSRLTVLLRGN
jgi:transcriptional regulator with XRE-family HTH domain